VGAHAPGSAKQDRAARSRGGVRRESLLGIENESERRLVYFQPTAVPEAQEFQFDRYTVEGLITVATGIDNPSVLPVILIWLRRRSRRALP